MVLSAFFPAIFISGFNFESKMFSFVGKLKSRLGLLFGKRSYSSLFSIGLLNGLLPCGPVYAALAAAIATGSAINGAGFMFAFGLATIPMLLAVSLLGNLMSINFRKKVTRYIPVAVFFIGVLFILRGLALGIPYLSPPDAKLDLSNKTSMKVVANNNVSNPPIHCNADCQI